MTSNNELERAVRALLVDDMNVMPEWLLDAVLADLPTTRQHRRWWPPRWLSPVAAPLRSVVTTVALVALVSIGVVWLSRPGGIGGPIPSASTPPPSPPASPSPAGPPPSATMTTPTPGPGYVTAPPGWPTPAPLTPASPLSDPPGSPLPADLVGRQYNTDPLETQGVQALVLTLRGADDPHCTAMYGGRSTCFTILWTPNYPKHIADPAVRGPARMEGDQLVLGFALVPSDLACEGTSSTYDLSPDGWTMRGADVPTCSFPGFIQH